jgi:hypothetical protein
VLLTDIQGYDEGQLAWFYNKTSPYAIDRFSVQAQRKGTADDQAAVPFHLCSTRKRSVSPEIPSPLPPPGQSAAIARFVFGILRETSSPPVPRTPKASLRNLREIKEGMARIKRVHHRREANQTFLTRNVKLSLHELSNIPHTKCQTLPTDKGDVMVYENAMILKERR